MWRCVDVHVQQIAAGFSVSQFLCKAFFHIVLVQVASELEWAEVVDITTEDLVSVGESEHAELLGDGKEQSRQDSGPGNDEQNADDLGTEEPSGLLTSVEDTLLRSEESNGKDTPDAAESMDLGCLEWIIDLQLIHQPA